MANFCFWEKITSFATYKTKVTFSSAKTPIIVNFTSFSFILNHYFAYILHVLVIATFSCMIKFGHVIWKKLRIYWRQAHH